MEIKVSETQTVTTGQQVQEKPAGTGEEFKFTLISHIDKKELADKLSSLMQSITEQGEKIAKHMDIRDMRRYRASVKEFMNEVVSNSHEFSRENFLDRRGRHRVYGIIRKVDENLDELATELLKDEKDHLVILQKVGEIRGLLLDIST